jgi:hypothetical protein
MMLNWPELCALLLTFLSIMEMKCTLRRFKALRYVFRALRLGIHFPNDRDNMSCHIKGTSKKFDAIHLVGTECKT